MLYFGGIAIKYAAYIFYILFAKFIKKYYFLLLSSACLTALANWSAQDV